MQMTSSQSARIISIIVCQCFFLSSASFAHPASGIVVDAQGRVVFIYSKRGVMRIEASGKLTNIHENSVAIGWHWTESAHSQT